MSEVPDGFQADTGVRLLNGANLLRIGDCVVGGALAIRDCPKLTEISGKLRTRGLTLHGATRLSRLPDGLKIEGDLRLINCPQLTRLPEGLKVFGSLIIRGCPRLSCLPLDVRIGADLYLIGRTRIENLPSHLSIGRDIVAERSIDGLAPGFSSVGNLALIGCASLEALPEGLRVGGDLIVRRCPRLDRLPAGLQVRGGLEARHARFRTLPDDIQVSGYIDLEGCALLESLPGDLKVPDCLWLRQCIRLKALPGGLEVGGSISGASARMRLWHYAAVGPVSSRRLMLRTNQLDLQNCSRLTTLPSDLKVLGGIEVAGSGLREIPAELDRVPLFWRGVEVPRRVALNPESFAAQEILEHPNVEVRRVLMEILGPERLCELLQPRVVDEDVDAGGRRRLLSVEVRNGWNSEPFVLLECRCPSSKRVYLLRTPPTMRSCHQAAAWLAGFEDPDDYKPSFET